ncbi:hypothetical protein HK405_000561 [Cladochytrium tenue]|nr:hypothetical protein HK405_000561 [Cladochytrium tenue]
MALVAHFPAASASVVVPPPPPTPPQQQPSSSSLLMLAAHLSSWASSAATAAAIAAVVAAASVVSAATVAAVAEDTPDSKQTPPSHTAEIAVSVGLADIGVGVDDSASDDDDDDDDVTRGRMSPPACPPSLLPTHRARKRSASCDLPFSRRSGPPMSQTTIHAGLYQPVPVTTSPSSSSTAAASTTPSLRRRLLRELRDQLLSESSARTTTATTLAAPYVAADGVLRLRPIASDLRRWRAELAGPRGGPYARGRFAVDLDVSQGYPAVAPRVRFATPVCHAAVRWPTGEVHAAAVARAWRRCGAAEAGVAGGEQFPLPSLRALCGVLVEMLARPDDDYSEDYDAESGNDGFVGGGGAKDALVSSAASGSVVDKRAVTVDPTGDLLRCGDRRALRSLARMYTRTLAM